MTTDFDTLLARFSAAVAGRDGAALASLFAQEGCYDDYFFGCHVGHEAIATMLERFYQGGEAFCWQFSEPVCAGDLGYASYCFSYRSREPESAGRLVVFEGISRFRLRHGLIEHYQEVFDRGVAFVQLGYETERVRKLLDRYAAGFASSEKVRAHLAYRESG